MGLLQRMKDDLRTGMATLRLGTAHAASRALEETELLRLRLDLRKIDQQLADLYKDIGERALEMKERGETTERVLYDEDIDRIAREVRELKEARKKVEAEMDEMRSER